jgi:hypothetical protein
VNFIHTRELAFLIWYGLWGSLATLFLTLAIMRTSLAERVLALVARFRAHTGIMPS